MNRSTGWKFLRNVGIKASLLFLAINIGYAWLSPRDFVGSLSGYNLIFPGRLRFPHSDVPEKAFNLTTANLPSMFRAHTLSKPPGDEEFRIFIIGDSSVWGFLLEPRQTFSAKLNEFGLQSIDGARVEFYNLGYPTLSATKDLLILDRANAYEPDMIIWLLTLESLVENTQLDSPLLSLNPVESIDLLERYDLELTDMHTELLPPTFLQRTIVGSRVELSELLRLQLYGFTWGATGVDHYIPDSYNERSEDLSADVTYKGYRPGEIEQEDLYFEAIDAGISSAGGIPVILINEPIFISEGENSDVRYNFFYPRWAYDRYRSLLRMQADRNEWHFEDFSELIPASEFTDSAIHYTSDGSELMAETIASILVAEFGFQIISR